MKGPAKMRHGEARMMRSTDTWQCTEVCMVIGLHALLLLCGFAPGYCTGF